MYTIYSKEKCTQSTQAKHFLDQNKKDYKVLMLDTDYKMEDLSKKIEGKGLRTFPVIFNDETLIGDLWGLMKSI